MRKYLPEDLIEDIRLNNDIIDVVSEYVKLEKRGKYYFGLCPFHNEKTPSFSVTPSMQIFNCFGCGKGGNVIHFIMNIEHLDFIDAIKLLADRAGIRLPVEEESEKDREKSRLLYQILDINQIAARYFYDNLVASGGAFARDYLKGRNILTKTARTFGLGYSLSGRDDLYKHLLSKGFTNDIIIESGLITKSKEKVFIDRFRDRLMFPIFNVRGKVIGFGGRALGSVSPKYVNSPETVVYNKGSNLYGLNFARNSGESKLIVVEGYMDVISLHQSGINNSIASLGTSLTYNQGRLLRRYGEEIIVSFDADEAGKAAAVRSLDLLSDLGCTVKVLTIPGGKDPDDFIREKGPDAFKRLADNALSSIEFKINEIKRVIDTRDAEGKIRFLKEVAKILSKLKNRVEIEIYIKKFAGAYEISEGALHAEVLKHFVQKKHFKEVRTSFKKDENKGLTQINTNSGKNKEVFSVELILFAILCRDNGLYKLIKDKISIDKFSERNKEIASRILGMLESNADITTGKLLNVMDTETAGEFTKIVNTKCNFDNHEKALFDIVNKMKELELREKKKRILMDLESTNNNQVEKKQSLLSELNILVKELKTIQGFHRKEG